MNVTVVSTNCSLGYTPEKKDNDKQHISIDGPSSTHDSKWSTSPEAALDSK